MNLQDYQGVYVFVQQVDNKITGVSFELIGKARELAAAMETEVTAVLLGSNVSELCDELARFGADKIVVLADGRVAEQGAPEELLARDGLYAHMAALQAESQNWALKT